MQILAVKGVEVIVPAERWESLEDVSAYKYFLELTSSIVSLPCYPALCETEAKYTADIAGLFR